MQGCSEASAGAQMNPAAAATAIIETLAGGVRLVKSLIARVRRGRDTVELSQSKALLTEQEQREAEMAAIVKAEQASPPK